MFQTLLGREEGRWSKRRKERDGSIAQEEISCKEGARCQEENNRQESDEENS